MALKIGNVEPTQIFIPNSSSLAAPTTVSFPTGKKSAIILKTDAKAYAMATFTSTSTYSCTGIKINGVVIPTTSVQVYSENLINESTGFGTTRTYYARFENGTLTLEQAVNQAVSISSTATSAMVMGKAYSTSLIEGTSVNKVQVKKGSSTTAVWGKPYSLVTNSSDCDILAYRNTSPNQHASAGTLTGGGTVYYGDTVQISITPKTLAQYELSSVTINGTEQLSGVADSFSKTLTIENNTIVRATASKRKLKLTAATIDGYMSYDPGLGNYGLIATVTNPNSVSVTASIKIYKNYDSIDKSLTYTIEANNSVRAQSTVTFAEAIGKIEVVLSKTGYADSATATKTFGNYQETEEPETTTTTTTTTTE